MSPAGEAAASAARIPVPSALSALEGWVRDGETRFADLVPGTEKRIDWHDGVERTPVAVVYLHGFSATRQETAPLAADVARALGANAFHTRLTGHGLDGAALGRARLEDWLEDGREALAVGRLLGERVVVIACSTGATLAVALAMEAGSAAALMDALVLVSPNFGVANRTAAILNWRLGLPIARLMAGRERSFVPVNERHARFWTTRYPIEAIATMMQLLLRVARGDPAAVDVPVLTLYSPADAILDVAAIRRVHGAFPHPGNRLVAVENAEDPSQHVIAGDILSPSTTAAVATQIERFVAERLSLRGAAGAAAG